MRTFLVILMIGISSVGCNSAQVTLSNRVGPGDQNSSYAISATLMEFEK